MEEAHTHGLVPAVLHDLGFLSRGAAHFDGDRPDERDQVLTDCGRPHLGQVKPGVPKLFLLCHFQHSLHTYQATELQEVHKRTCPLRPELSQGQEVSFSRDILAYHTLGTPVLGHLLCLFFCTVT